MDSTPLFFVTLIVFLAAPVLLAPVVGPGRTGEPEQAAPAVRSIIRPFTILHTRAQNLQIAESQVRCCMDGALINSNSFLMTPYLLDC